MRALKNISFLKYRHKAEEAAGALPGLIMAAEKAATSILSGDHAQRKSGMGEKFWQFREYDTSDRPQDIDWRQSAKGDRVYVREKEWQTTQTAMLWCQRNEGMDYHSQDTLPTKQDTAMTLTMALGILLSRAGEQIAPLEGSAMPGRSSLAIQNLGEQLIENHTGDLPDTALRKIPRNSSLILVGDFLAPSDEIKEIFDLLANQAQNAMVVQVLDPAELTLPFDGRVIFERSNANEQHHVDNVETIRTAYQERLHDHMGFIKDYCKKHQWNWLLHTTDEDISNTLFDSWMMMAPESFHGGSRK